MRTEHLQHRGPAALAALVALLVVAGLPAPAGAQPDGAARARVSVYPGGVDLVPEVAYSQAVLTVSGNGQAYRYELAPGEPLSIGVFDPAGQLLADGSYSWSLELVPTEVTAARLRAEAADNGGRALAPWTAQSGTFAIRGGAIADPALAEEQALRRAADDATQARPGSRTTSALGADRAAAEDDDAAVGSRAGVEEQLSAAAARRAPAAAGGALSQPDRADGDDSDAVAAALGRSLEPAAASDKQLSAQTRGAFAPPPRSDGSNGRPRS